MTIINDGAIKIAQMSDYSEFLDEQEAVENQVHLVIFDEQDESLPTYPHKITHELNIPDTLETFLSSLNKKKRYNLKRLHRLCSEKYEVEVLEEFSQEEFNTFRDEYEEFISNKELGEVRIGADWYQKRADKHFMLVYKSKETGKRVGGTLVKKFKKSPKLSMSFGWVKDEARKQGLATFEILELIKYAIANGWEIISYGQDVNLYGGHLSTGLHYFKVYFGATPKVPYKVDIGSIYVTDLVEKEDVPIVFYTVDEQEQLKENRYNC